MQECINAVKQDADKFVAAVIKDSNGVSYFVVPEVDINGVWCKGLDGKAKVSDCIALFDTKTEALSTLGKVGTRFINDGFSCGATFKTIYHANGDLQLVDVKRLPLL